MSIVAQLKTQYMAEALDAGLVISMSERPKAASAIYLTLTAIAGTLAGAAVGWVVTLVTVNVLLSVLLILLGLMAANIGFVLVNGFGHLARASVKLSSWLPRRQEQAAQG